MYQFETATRAHLEMAREIYLYYINHTTATYHMHEVSLQEMADLLLMENPKYESYVIKTAEGEICGYVLLTQFKTREAFRNTAEVTIYLKQGFEGKGIGTKALGFIEERARIKAFHTLVALICGENKGSIALFEKCGYKCCAQYKEIGNKFGRWLDLLAYQKLL